MIRISSVLSSRLNYISGANCDVPIGKIVYTQFLNEDGGIEADVTVTRLSELSFMMNGLLEEIRRYLHFTQKY